MDLKHDIVYHDEKNKIKIYECWGFNNVLHNPNGPALIHYNLDGSVDCECYYINGKQSRLDGPAYIAYSSNNIKRIERYFIDNVVFKNKEEWFVALPMKYKIKYMFSGDLFTS